MQRIKLIQVTELTHQWLKRLAGIHAAKLKRFWSLGSEVSRLVEKEVKRQKLEPIETEQQDGEHVESSSQ